MEHENLNTEETANSDLGDVSGSILINAKGRKLYMITSNCVFFQNSIVYKVDYEKIIFKLAGIDDYKQIKPFKNTKNNYGFNLSTEYDLPLKKIEFDKEESTEDKLVVYYR